jgi:HEAT repeat
LTGGARALIKSGMLAVLASWWWLVALAPQPALSAGAGATVKLPELSQLVRAVRNGDDVEIERVAARLGALRLEHVAEKGKREERLAALRALPLVDGGCYLLPDLVRLFSDGDADVAEAAGVAVRQIAAGLSPQEMFDREVPRDVPARAAAGLMDAARRAELRPSLRVAAIGDLASLRRVTKLDENTLLRLLGDGEPQVRRAAADALAGVAPAEPPLVHAVEEDPAPEVAAAAAAALCRDVPATGEKGGDKGAAFERAARLSPRARDRLRTLAADEQLALVDRLDLLGCVRVHAQPPDQKLLDQLARAKQDAVKRRARSLGGR